MTQGSMFKHETPCNTGKDTVNEQKSQTTKKKTQKHTVFN